MPLPAWLRVFPTHRGALLALSLALLALMAGLRVVHLPDAEVAFVLVTLELLLPIAVALVACALLGSDPVLELLLTVPRPAWGILLQRLAVLLGVVALLVGTLLLVAWREEHVVLPIRTRWQPLIALAPLLFYTGIALVASLRRGRAVEGMAAVAGAALISLMALPFLAELCLSERTLEAPTCPLALLSPQLTLFRAYDPYWLANRAAFCAVGLLLIITALWSLRRVERLVGDGADS